MADPILYVSAALILSVLLTVILVRFFADRAARLRRELEALQSSKQSLASTYGRITEQWAPFMSDYPYEPRNFRFLGSPVDGVQFEDDRIVFIEFKANESRLTARQQRMKELVQSGRVEWHEVRIAEHPRAPPPAAPPGPAATPEPATDPARYGQYYPPS